MEGHVLSTIGWGLGHPTAEAWLRIACAAGPTFPMEEAKTQHVARFLMEITLFHRAFVSIKPSDIALACLTLARYQCGLSGDVPCKVSCQTGGGKARAEFDLTFAHTLLHSPPTAPISSKSHRCSMPILRNIWTKCRRQWSRSVSGCTIQILCNDIHAEPPASYLPDSPSFYSRASTHVREWYLSGCRFSVVQTHFEARPCHPSSEAPEIVMTHSSPSSSSSSGRRGGDSDFEDDEDLSYSSTPITPTTSVSSCSTSSDPVDRVRMEHLPYDHTQRYRQSSYFSENPRRQSSLPVPVATRDLHTMKGMPAHHPPQAAPQQQHQQSQSNSCYAISGSAQLPPPPQQHAGMQWQMNVQPPPCEST